MENSDYNATCKPIDHNKPDNILEPERARAWIFTLALGVLVCLGLIIYSSVTHHPAINFLDSSLFKPGLVWLGFVGLFLFLITYLLFDINTNVLKFLPDNKQWINVTAISGLFILLLAFFLLFISYDIENRLLHYLGFTL